MNAKSHATPRRLIVLVVAVDILAVLVVALLPLSDLYRAPATLWLMLSLSVLTGYRPIHIRSLRTRVAASDPFLFATIAALGSLPAVLVGLVSIVSTMIGARMRFDLVKTLFNLAAAAISISVASSVFALLASGTNSILQQVLPLTAAATVYFLINTSLISAAISIEGATSFFSTWTRTSAWTAVTNYCAATIAVALLFLLDFAGPAGIVLGVPPLWLFSAYYRSHRDRLTEQQRRMEQILESNQRLEQEVRARTAELAAKVTELERAKDHLRELANTDELTLLPNRRRFQHHLARELSRSQRFKHSFSVLMIDVDHFKRINDEYGHPMGDLVLQQLATILDQNVRAADLAARYGGEEYAAVLAETPKFGALALAKQLRRLVAEHSFGIGDEAGPNRVTISIGIATFPEDADDADELILIADQRLYQAKETGRDRVVA
jgi:diguanylate cyclase (GGDEF)-like protein